MEEIKKGLVGVVADETKVSKVMPETNSLTYRGYAVQDLAEHKSFTEVAYLLFNGELPNEAELTEFNTTEKHNRSLPPELLAMLKQIPPTAHPMDVVRSAVSFLGCADSVGAKFSNKNLTEIKTTAVKLFAKLPTIVAAFKLLREGKNIIAPDESLDYVDNFFHMCFGKTPDALVKKVFDISMTLYAEHGFNASTFTARVITSTESDIYGAITGAIAALKGPLHGGANEAVMHMMLEIDDPTQAAQWMKDALRDKKKIMGFGHRVYRSGDSRVPTMKKAFFSLAEKTGQTKWCKMYDALAEEMEAAKKILPNLDFPAGPAYYLMGFDIDFFTPFFVMSRITGWTAHVLEQTATNKLIRPSAVYSGVEQRSI